MAKIMIVDDREARTNAAVVTHLENDGRQVDRMRLDYGDFSFYGERFGGIMPRIGIEVCTVADLLGKISTNRFGMQLSGCLNFYDITILLIEGYIQRDMRTGAVKTYGFASGMPYARVRSLLFSAKAHGVIVEEVSAGKKAIANAIIRYQDYYDKQTHNTFSVDKNQVRLAPNRALDRAVVTLMQMVDGIGEKKATDAIEYFGNLNSMIIAYDHEIRKVTGWGPTTIRNFRNTLNRGLK